MVQQPARPPIQYCCRVNIEQATGNAAEEIMTFGTSPEGAQQEAAQILAQRGLSAEQITELMQQAEIEALGQWCAREGE